MTADQLKPHRILRGPLFPEPVEVLVASPTAGAVKLVGRGVRTNEVADIILTPDKLDLAQATPDAKPFDRAIRDLPRGISQLLFPSASDCETWAESSLAA
jgi:hypothetical protein